MEMPFRKAVIIDDEADGRNMIALLLAQFFPGIELAGQAENITQGHALISTTHPDLIFLDIEMPDGNAFDLLSLYNPLPADVILVTAYDHYAIKAIKSAVLDYLLKPVNKEEFIAAVNKALMKRKQEHNNLSELLLSVQKHLVVRKIRIATLNGFMLANVDDIIRCEASGNYTIFVFTDRAHITACRSLGEYEEELKGYGFVRIHHKHLVNVNHIAEYNKGKKGGGYVIMHGKEILEVSARKKAELIRIL